MNNILLQENKPKKTGLARLLEIAGERRWLLIVACIFASLSSLCMLLPVVAVYFVLVELLNHAGNVGECDKNLLFRWAGLAGGGLLLSLLLTYLGAICSHIAAFRILYGIRVRLVSHLGRLPLGYLSNTSTGAVKKVLQHSVEEIENFVAHGIPDLASSAAMTLFIGLGLLYVDWRLSIAMVVPLILSWVVMSTVMSGEKGAVAMKQYHDMLERMNASAVQFVRGMPAIKAFGQTVHSFRRFHHDIVDYRKFAVQITFLWQNPYVGMLVLLQSLAVFVLPVGVFLIAVENDVVQKTSLALTLLFFLLIAPGVIAPYLNAMMIAMSTSRITEGVARIDKILDTPILPEPLTPKTPVGHDVSFEDVSFSYKTSDSETENGTPALDHVSFRAEAGKITALVGPSGSGKSTTAHLIPRFWDVDSGAIRIGGVDLREIATERLMDHVSFVFQDTFLFYDTLLENIRIGKPEANDGEVHVAAKAAQCHDFIENLPQGYATRIGEGGVYLSGGEEQRVAVARAILRNAPILVLDEATAFADPENEHRMHLALSELMKGKTVIVIAHRLASIVDADRILVFDEGRIVQQGTHEELLQYDGRYKKMWDAYIDTSTWELKSIKRN